MSETPDQDYMARLLNALEVMQREALVGVREALANGKALRDTLLTVKEMQERFWREYLPSEPMSVHTLGDLAEGYFAYVQARKEAAPTGICDALDKALGGGLQPGRLMALLGAPGSGKTTLANQIAEHIASSGRPVVYVTSEDPPEILLAKTIARLSIDTTDQTGLDYHDVVIGTEARRPRIREVLRRLKERESASRLLYVYDTGKLSLEAIQECARTHFQACDGSGLLVIDYLQRLARSLLHAGWQGMELRHAVTLLTERLRAVATDLDCTVLALASQNRASGYGSGKENNGLASAKESGDVEYTCDVVLTVGEDKEAKYKPTLPHKAWALHLVKNRQGENDKKIELDWWGARQQFVGVRP